MAPSTNPILDVQLGVSGATGDDCRSDAGVVDTAQSLPVPSRIRRILCSDNNFREALTFPGPQTTVNIGNDMVVPAGFMATDIEKQFSQIGVGRRRHPAARTA